MKKVILYIAMSLDGFIADENGRVEWLEGQDLNNQEEGSYLGFVETIDTVIMGYKTYHQIVTDLSPDQWPYAGLQSYVLTHQNIPSENEITFTHENIKYLIEKLQKEEGKNIWICGGADLVNQLVNDDLIDRYHVTIIPIILGNGVSLFHKSNPTIKLQLLSTKSYNGMTDMIFERR